MIDRAFGNLRHLDNVGFAPANIFGQLVRFAVQNSP